jgi:hypothetical protein
MASGATPAVPSATVSAQPVRLLPVLARALGDYIAGFIARLFGRKRK